MIHIYCGDGKGKTSAALGLAVRAAGRGKRVLIARFLKSEDSGEVTALRQIKEIEVIPCEKTFGFYKNMTKEVRQEAKEYYENMLHTIFARIEQEKMDMLILDEAMAACQYNMISEDEIIDFLKYAPDTLEIVLTGRNPSVRMLECADYITEMKKQKHPFDRGVLARKGIEF